MGGSLDSMTEMSLHSFLLQMSLSKACRLSILAIKNKCEVDVTMMALAPALID